MLIASQLLIVSQSAHSIPTAHSILTAQKEAKSDFFTEIATVFLGLGLGKEITTGMVKIAIGYLHFRIFYSLGPKKKILIKKEITTRSRNNHRIFTFSNILRPRAKNYQRQSRIEAPQSEGRNSAQPYLPCINTAPNSRRKKNSHSRKSS